MFTTMTTTKINANLNTIRWAYGYVIMTLIGSFATPQMVSAQSTGPCLTRSEMSVMFETDTSETVAYDIAAAHTSALAFAVEGGTWPFTATDGSVEQGQAITLTYSFVPDGTPISSAYADADTVSHMFATVDANFPGGRSAWKQMFADALADWSKHTNITYIEVSDDGAALSTLSFGILGVRGDIRIGMHEIGAGPLAYNFYPTLGGDMVLDSLDMATFTNPASDFRTLRNVITHEHGHGLGLSHVIPGNNTKLMEPNLVSAFVGPQEDDIRAVQFLYGDRDESNDLAEDARLTGDTLRSPTTVGVQSFFVDGLALERADSADWYAFTALASVPMAIRVEPTGTTYEFGPQDGVTQFIDAKATRDLKLRLWRRVSVQTGQLSLLAQIDFNAAGEAEYHPPVPYTLAGYILAEIYSDDGVDDVQTYTLTISNSAIEAPVESPIMSVTDGLNLVTTADTVLFDDTTVGQTSGKALTIRNNGAGPLRFDGQPSVSLAGPGANDFQVQLAVSQVAPDGFAVLGISFTPTQAGPRVAVLSIANNDPDQADFSFIIRGDGLAAPEAVIDVRWESQNLVSGDELEFGEVLVGESLDTTLTIRNLGEALLNITDIQISGEAAVDYTLDLFATTVAPNDVQIATLTVTPSSTGVRNATLTIVSDATGTSFEMLLATQSIVEIVDCNGNGIDDADDVLGDGDCNANGMPDDCELDSDGDTVIDACDNCPDVFNADQLDVDGNGVGDACEVVDAEPVDVDEPIENEADVNDVDVEEDPVEVDVVDIDVAIENDIDDTIDDDALGDKEIDNEPNLDENGHGQGNGICGMGVAGMIPAMMFGLCGMRPRRRT